MEPTKSEGGTGSEGSDVEDGGQLEFEDSLRIQATRDSLWNTISDPEVLANCVPGAESIERHSKRQYSLEITRGLSSLTISLDGEVELVEMNEPDWIVASGHAYDRRAHSEFEGVAAMEMTEIDDRTVRLDYKASLNFTGGVATIPTRIVRRLVTSDVDAYFENIKSVVEDDTQ